MERRVGDMDEIDLDSYIQFCEKALGGSGMYYAINIYCAKNADVA